MPAAPLAKGLIFSISILLAAGFAVYENPQVRQWVDETRHKIAIALHSLGDEINPPRTPRSNSTPDASTREDDSPEGFERRRRAREEILRRGQMMEERRQARARSGQTSTIRGMSFDDMVDEEGKLKNAAEKSANTTAAETVEEKEGLRKRNNAVTNEALGAAMGAMLADPFADEKGMDFHENSTMAPALPHQQSRDSTTTLPADSPVAQAEPLVPYQEDRSHLVNNDTTSTHPSELLVDLTPTTSHASARDDLSELSGLDNTNDHEGLQSSQVNYHSVNEWAENSSASFYSPPQSEAAYGENRTRNAATVSDAGTGEHVEHMSDIDVVSEAGEGTFTPISWTEVGSVVSEED